MHKGNSTRINLQLKIFNADIKPAQTSPSTWWENVTAIHVSSAAEGVAPDFLIYSGQKTASCRRLVGSNFYVVLRCTEYMRTYMINPWGLRVQFILEGGCLLKQEVSTSHHPSSRSRLAPSPFDAHILHTSKRHRLDNISILDTNPVVNRASGISATRRVDTVLATDQHDTAHLLQSFANPVCASIY